MRVKRVHAHEQSSFSGNRHHKQNRFRQEKAFYLRNHTTYQPRQVIQCFMEKAQFPILDTKNQ